MNTKTTHIWFILSIVINVFLSCWLYVSKVNHKADIQELKENHLFWKGIDKMRTDFELKMCQDNYDWQRKIHNDEIAWLKSQIPPKTKNQLKQEREKSLKISEYLQQHPFSWWH